MSIFSTNVVTPNSHWAKKGTRNKPVIKLLCYLCVCDSIFLTDIRKYMPPDVAFSETDYQLACPYHDLVRADAAVFTDTFQEVGEILVKSLYNRIHSSESPLPTESAR